MFDFLHAIPPLLLLGLVLGIVMFESLGVPLPGETVLIAATLISVNGGVPAWQIALAAVIGAVIGDSIGFEIGKRWGKRVFIFAMRKAPTHFTPSGVHGAVDLMDKYGPWAVLFGRFVALLRIFAGPLAGTLGMHYGKFLAANLTGSILWAGGVVTLVSLLGEAVVAILHQAAWLLLVLVAVAAAVIVLVVLVRRKRAPRPPKFEPRYEDIDFELLFVPTRELAGRNYYREPSAPVIVEGDEDPVTQSTPVIDTEPAPAAAQSSTPAAASSDPETIANPAPLSQALKATLLPVWGILRRYPVTSALFIVFVVVGFVLHTFWQPAFRQDWFAELGYGLPAFQDGRWWTLVTGTFFSAQPLFNIFSLLAIVLFVSWAERHYGSWRTLGLFWVGQIVGVLGAAGILLLLTSTTDSAWAARLSTELDSGPSCGTLFCLALVIAHAVSPWRMRLFLAFGVYLLIWLVYVGNIDGLEHTVAGVPALLIAYLLVRRKGKAPATTHREWRLVAFASLITLGLIEVIAALLPNTGPLGYTGLADGPWLDVAIDLLIIALIANGIRIGLRVAWVFALLAASLNILYSVALVTIEPLSDIDGVEVTLANTFLWIGVFVILVVGYKAFRVPFLRSRRRFGSRVTTAQVPYGLLRKYGGSTLSWMGMWPENSYFMAASGQAYIAYQKHSGVAIALGDPVGPPGTAGETIAEYAAQAESIGLVPALFSVSEASAAVAPEGWRALQVAEDTVVDLPGLALTGKKWQHARTAVNRAAREGITFSLVTLADEPWDILSQVRAISEQWVDDKALPEMGFTLGGVTEALDRNVRVGLALDGNGTVQGVTSWLPVFGPEGTLTGWTLDLMRRKDDGFGPVIEFLLASSMLAFSAEGALTASLSGAPLARSGGDEELTAVDRLLDGIGQTLEPVYGFRSLHRFKMKFNPRFEKMYLLYRDEADLPRIGLGLTRAFMPDASLRDLAVTGLTMGKK